MVVFDGLGNERFGYEVKKRPPRPYIILNRHERRKLKKLLRTSKEHTGFFL